MFEFSTLIFIIAIIFGAIIHEYSHAWMADRLGDPTARYAGRLTLNPAAHIDPFGTVLMPLMLMITTMGKFAFAYAKPVPYDPRNLRDQRISPALVGVAGPLSNLFTAIILGIVVRFAPISENFMVILIIFIQANILLLVFNLVPIPPLDGSKILYAFLPDSWDRYKMVLEQYGMFIVLVFAIFFFKMLIPIINGLLFLIVAYNPF